MSQTVIAADSVLQVRADHLHQALADDLEHLALHGLATAPPGTLWEFNVLTAETILRGRRAWRPSTYSARIGP